MISLPAFKTFYNPRRLIQNENKDFVEYNFPPLPEDCVMMGKTNKPSIPPEPQ